MIIGVSALLFYALVFPIRYGQAVYQLCEQYEVEPSDVFAIIWTESKFDTRARSNKGACGLMQLTPSTAKWCCDVLEIDYSESKLYNAEFNLRLGIFYYKYLLDKFDDTEKALAAYNAGEGNVLNWLSSGEYEIRFAETKRYVATVVSVSKIYKNKLK